MTDWQELIDSPIDNAERANKLWLPQGKKSAPRQADKYQGVDENFAPSVKRSTLAKMAEESFSSKITIVLDYYAKSDVPFDRIVEHTGMDIGKVTLAMNRRGRTA